MKILDRYILQKVLLPFFYCFIGFIAIWFIFDLSDNLPDFLQGHLFQTPDGWHTLLNYYKSQIPEIIVMCLPIGELLALLYALTALSRSNELISMLGAGLSVNRILIPLFALGVVLVGITAAFNYDQAPHAELIKKQMVRDIKHGRKIETGLSGHLYRNRADYRTWFIRKVMVGNERLDDVQVIGQDSDGFITQEWYAREAYYDPAKEAWAFVRAKYVEMDKAGKITKSEFHDKMLIKGWRETPWRIASSVMKPEFLSVPELHDYLEYNHDFPPIRLSAYKTELQYRWSLPWMCLLVVFIAAPMGIVYSRRGILGGVAIAISLFFSYVFTSYLFLALGRGSRISPFSAAWGPLIIFGFIGGCLLWYRSTNRDLPKLKLPWLS